MGFSLQLAQDLVEVEAGTTTPVTITVVNRGGASDRYELEVEGVDADWKAIPVPSFAAEPGETHIERFFVKPPRTSESLAGNYPFVVRVRSLESGEQRTAQGVIRLKPFHHLSMEIDPKKGTISPTSKRNVFDITVVNLGNAEHTVQVVGSDPEDACTYEFEHEQINLGPGQQKDVEVTVRPVSTPIFSSGRLIGFSVAARSIDAPSVVTTAQAQLEQRSLISPSLVAVVIVFALIVGAWILMMPKEPTVQLGVSTEEVTAGQKVTVSWSAHDANHVVITGISFGETTPKQLVDTNNPTGTIDYTPTSAGDAQITAIAFKDQRQGNSVHEVVKVDAAPAPIIPEIKKFSASSQRVPRNATVTFKWKVIDAATVDLAPVQTGLNPELGAIQETIKDDADYQLVAYSKDGNTAKSKTIHISVYDVSDAKILAFSASPASVEPGGSTTLSWQVTNAVRVELHEPDGTVETVDPTATRSFPIQGTPAKSKFTLVAYDSQARTASQTVAVSVKPPPAISTPGGENTTGFGPPATGGGTGTATGTTAGGGTG